MLDRDFEKLLEESCSDERIDRFKESHLEPFEYFDYAGSEEKSLKFQGQIIKKMTFMYSSWNQNTGPTAVIQFTLTPSDSSADKAKKIIITKSIKVEKMNELVNAFLKRGIQPDLTFTDMGVDPISWFNTSMRTIYADNITKFKNDPYITYRLLHLDIMNAIEHIIKEYGLDKVNIVDAGCGDGILPKLLEGRLQEQKKEAKIVGYDQLEQNIDDCKLDYKGQCQFLTGNSLALNSLLTDWKEHNILHKEWPTVLTFSGSLTRKVLPHGFEAAQVLQQAALNEVDYIIGGGHTVPLLTKAMMKRIGYKKVPIEAKHLLPNVGSFFTYQKLTLEEILQNKIKKIQNRKILDLTLSPNPEKILQILSQRGFINDNLESIDLSFCNLTPELIAELNKISDKLPNLKVIYWHWENDNTTQFIEQFAGRFTDVITRTIPTTQDWYLMRGKGFYASLQSTDQAPALYLPKLFGSRNDTNHVSSPKLERKDASTDIWMSNFGNFLKNNPDKMNIKLILKYISYGLGLRQEASPFENLEAILSTIGEKNREIHLTNLKSDVAFIQREQQNYICELKAEVDNGNYGCLPELIYVYHNGLTTWQVTGNKPQADSTFSNARYNKPFSPENSEEYLKELLKMYHDLAQTNPNFDPEVMKSISEWHLINAKIPTEIRISLTNEYVKLWSESGPEKRGRSSAL